MPSWQAPSTVKDIETEPGTQGRGEGGNISGKMRKDKNRNQSLRGPEEKAPRTKEDKRAAGSGAHLGAPALGKQKPERGEGP